MWVCWCCGIDLSKQKLMEVFLLFIASGLAIQKKKESVCDSPRSFFLQQCIHNFFSVLLSSHFFKTRLKHFTYWVWFGKGTSALSSGQDNFL